MKTYKEFTGTGCESYEKAKEELAKKFNRVSGELIHSRIRPSFSAEGAPDSWNWYLKVEANVEGTL